MPNTAMASDGELAELRWTGDVQLDFTTVRSVSNIEVRCSRSRNVVFQMVSDDRRKKCWNARYQSRFGETKIVFNAGEATLLAADINVNAWNDVSLYMYNKSKRVQGFNASILLPGRLTRLRVMTVEEV